MDDKNITTITTIHFLGLQTSQYIRFFVFFVFLIIYSLTICANLFIVILVICTKILHSPMYVFLSQLSISDILISTDIVPNILNSVLVEDPTIPFSSCLTQFFFFAASECLECLLLTVMSYDRYLAICRPLHYSMIMNHRICWMMVTASWIISLSLGITHTSTVSKLQFCRPIFINQFFCDLNLILGLSCSDTAFAQLEIILISSIFAVFPFFIIIVSYIYILVTIFQIPSITGRQKAFSTCSSHLIVVSVYYGTLLCVYLVPNTEESLNITKFLSLLYTVFTPLMNPIIYSLRNKDLRQALGKHLTAHKLA